MWVFLYAFIYMPWFLFLEKHVTTKYHVMQTALDERIPFIEYFIVPYLMWFAFIAVVFLYFFFTDVQGFYKLAAISFAGMTIFLIICTFFPNGQDLRPAEFPRHNVFTWMVSRIYAADTNTNVCPSMHVIGCVGLVAACCESPGLRRRHLQWVMIPLGVLICISTVFVKQHSILDMFVAIPYSAVAWLVSFQPWKRKKA